MYHLYNSPKYLKSLADTAAWISDKNASYLVTGVTGLIGSYLVDVLFYGNRFFKHKNNIILIGRSKERIRERFSFFLEEPFTIIERNICDPLPEELDADYIIHLASNADPLKYSAEPVETMLTNIYGTNNILKLCINKSAKVLLASSYEVYGSIDTDLYFEDNYGLLDFNAFRSMYPESKRCAELLAHSYFDEYKINTVIARLAGIFGPTMTDSDSKAQAQFLRNAISKEPIVMKSQGLQKRSYCYVADAVSALLHILYNGVSGEAYNVRGEDGISTILNFAEMVSAVSGTEVVQGAPSAAEKKGYSKPQDYVLDISKLREIGWKGRYSFADGISETLGIFNEA